MLLFMRFRQSRTKFGHYCVPAGNANARRKPICAGTASRKGFRREARRIGNSLCFTIVNFPEQSASSSDGRRPKLIRLTTVASSLDGLLRGQLRFLNERFEVVGVASGEETLRKVSAREGVRCVDVPMRREISLRQDLKSLFALIRLFRRERPFIVHANTPKGSLLAMTAAFLTRVPHRIYMVTGLRFETTSGAFRLLLKTMERLTCLFATKVIPEGEGVKATLLRERITRKPLEKIRNGNINGADLEFFKRTPEIEARAAEIRREIGAGAGTFVFMFAGRIVRDKGVNELVRAFSALRQECGGDAARLLLLGNFEDALDPVAPETRTEISRENSGIFAPGFREDLRPYYAAADAFVLPSYREGFPNAVIQAGAMGVPAIVSDVNGCNEIVIPGENGAVVPARDETALLAAMRRFVDGRADAVPAMASRSRALIASRYAREDVWAALLDMYFSLK